MYAQFCTRQAASIFLSFVWSTTDRLIAGNAEWQNQKSFASRISPTCIVFTRANRMHILTGGREADGWFLWIEIMKLWPRIYHSPFVHARFPRTLKVPGVTRNAYLSAQFMHRRPADAFFSTLEIFQLNLYDSFFLPPQRLTSGYASLG